jgi:hypothetical protein
MGFGLQGLGPTGMSGGGCCGGTSGTNAMQCCQGLASGQGNPMDLLTQLRQLAQQDPQGVINALKANPQLAQQLMASIMNQNTTQQQATTVPGIDGGSTM